MSVSIIRRFRRNRCRSAAYSRAQAPMPGNASPAAGCVSLGVVRGGEAGRSVMGFPHLIRPVPGVGWPPSISNSCQKMVAGAAHSERQKQRTEPIWHTYTANTLTIIEVLFTEAHTGPVSWRARMNHLPEVLKILEGALRSNAEQAVNYA